MSNTFVNLVTYSDFTEFPYNIVTSNTMPTELLTAEITKRQKEFLLQILGFQEYYDLQEDNSGAFPTTQKWIDFINGVAYTKNSKTIDYPGVKPALKLFIYYWYQRDIAVLTGSFGGKTLTTENSVKKNSEQKATDAFNEMVKLIGYVSNDTPTIYNYLNDKDFDAEMTIFKTINNIF
jgi:hypothetical protein